MSKGRNTQSTVVYKGQWIDYKSYAVYFFWEMVPGDREVKRIQADEAEKENCWTTNSETLLNSQYESSIARRLHSSGWPSLPLLLLLLLLHNVNYYIPIPSTRIPDVYTHSQTDEGSFPGQKEILLWLLYMTGWAQVWHLNSWPVVVSL